MKATEDFVTVVLHGYIIAGATQLLKDEPAKVFTCNEIAKGLVRRWIKISRSSSTAETPLKGTDYSYAMDFMSLGLLWHGFHDAVREGDGDRIIRYWRFLLPVFKLSDRRNYALEAFKLLAQVILLPPRQVAELKRGRTVNTVGRTGHNVPCDLHMEHLNRRLKFMMENLGSNMKPQCIKSIACSLGILSKICCRFEEEGDANQNKDYHTFPAFKKDLSLIVSQLISDNVFGGDDHRKFTLYNKSPMLQYIDWDMLSEWIKDKITDLDL